MENAHVAVVDLGSRQNIGWAIDGRTSLDGDCIESFIDAVAASLAQGPLALGFEAPMFVPFHRDSTNLTRGRKGEGDRPFSAAAGSTVLVTGLVTVPYVLSGLKSRIPSAIATFEWRTRLSKPNQVLLFEAFVTHQGNQGGDNRHIEDAKCAIRKFQDGMRNPLLFESAVTEPYCMSLLGAALLLTGWTTDLSVLSKACLVVRHHGEH